MWRTEFQAREGMSFLKKVTSEQSSDGIEKGTKWKSESTTLQACGGENAKPLKREHA